MTGLARDGAHLSKVQTCAFTSVVVISVHMEDLLAFDREQTRQNTFGETGSQHNDLQEGVKIVHYIPRCPASDLHRIPHP